jgi:hypothetical protein
VWGAAAYADRVNGGEYRKEPEYLAQADGTLTTEIVRHPNKVHMRNALQENTLITDSDIKIGQQARDYVRKNLVIKGLKGSMSDFDRAMVSAVEMNEFMTGADRYEIA